MDAIFLPFQDSEISKNTLIWSNFSYFQLFFKIIEIPENGKNFQKILIFLKSYCYKDIIFEKDRSNCQ